ncbi:DUF218 domain protein, partial [Aureobasidium melanogenum]
MDRKIKDCILETELEQLGKETSSETSSNSHIYNCITDKHYQSLTPPPTIFSQSLFPNSSVLGRTRDLKLLDDSQKQRNCESGHLLSSMCGNLLQDLRRWGRFEHHSCTTSASVVIRQCHAINVDFIDMRRCRQSLGDFIRAYIFRLPASLYATSRRVAIGFSAFDIVFDDRGLPAQEGRYGCSCSSYSTKTEVVLALDKAATRSFTIRLDWPKRRRSLARSGMRNCGREALPRSLLDAKPATDGLGRQQELPPCDYSRLGQSGGSGGKDEDCCRNDPALNNLIQHNRHNRILKLLSNLVGQCIFDCGIHDEELRLASLDAMQQGLSSEMNWGFKLQDRLIDMFVTQFCCLQALQICWRRDVFGDVRRDGEERAVACLRIQGVLFELVEAIDTIILDAVFGVATECWRTTLMSSFPKLEQVPLPQRQSSGQAEVVLIDPIAIPKVLRKVVKGVFKEGAFNRHTASADRDAYLTATCNSTVLCILSMIRWYSLPLRLNRLLQSSIRVQHCPVSSSFNLTISPNIKPRNLSISHNSPFVTPAPSSNLSLPSSSVTLGTKVGQASNTTSSPSNAFSNDIFVLKLIQLLRLYSIGTAIGALVFHQHLHTRISDLVSRKARVEDFLHYLSFWQPIDLFSEMDITRAVCHSAVKRMKECFSAMEDGADAEHNGVVVLRYFCVGVESHLLVGDESRDDVHVVCKCHLGKLVMCNVWTDDGCSVENVSRHGNVTGVELENDRTARRIH